MAPEEISGASVSVAENLKRWKMLTQKRKIKMNTNNKVLYEPVDVEALATALAEDAWEEEVKAKGLKREDLYQPVIVPGDEVPLQEQVRPKWAYYFFALRDAYMSLINEYKPVEV